MPDRERIAVRQRVKQTLAIGIEIWNTLSMIKNTSPMLRRAQGATDNEAAAVEFLEQQRWGDAPACPRAAMPTSTR